MTIKGDRATDPRTPTPASRGFPTVSRRAAPTDDAAAAAAAAEATRCTAAIKPSPACPQDMQAIRGDLTVAIGTDGTITPTDLC